MSKVELYARDINGDGAVALRDSVSRGRPDLRFTSAEWSAFTAGVRHGEFDS
ncbi:MAG TPA: DUF397 domain-containing protein [Pseudonocardiaceae bacterium]|nr:DUF397 domain-containing protein [Pseudonocardiaceae bacterium]